MDEREEEREDKRALGEELALARAPRYIVSMNGGSYITLVDRPPFGPAIGPGSYQNRDQCLHRPGTGPGLAVQGQRPRFMWGNGPGWWQQPGPMLRRPTRGALRGIGPGCWPQPGLLPCLYKPTIQHFATLPQKIQHCVGVGWVLEFFFL